MQKIIIDPIKFTVRNLELVFIFFAASIIVKYVLVRIGLKDIPFAYIAISLFVNLCLISSTLNAICSSKNKGKWQWSDYFKGGIVKLPIIIIWVILMIFCINIVNLFLRFTNLSRFNAFSTYLFWVIVYLTALIPAAQIIGKTFKESIALQLSAIKNHLVNWIMSAVYILLITQITRIVVFTLWSNAMAYQNDIWGKALILTGEAARGMAFVVILTTVCNMLFITAEKSGAEIENRFQ